MANLQVLEATAILSLLLTIVGIIRRLYFHPLSHVPGPKLAAVTWWYEFYFDTIQGGRYVFKIQELHMQYGPVIRITPDEVHVNDVGFLDNIYAPSSARRDKYEYQLRTLRVPGGVGTTVLHDVHKKRREALAPFFSKRNVLKLENLISEKVEQLCQACQKHAEDGTPLNLSDVFFAFSNDVVNNFLFAHQTDVLANEDQAATMRRNSNQLLLGININKHFPWIPDLLESLPRFFSQPIMPPGLVDMLSLFDRVRAELITIINAKSSNSTIAEAPGRAGKESVYSSILDNPVLPLAERSLLRLEQEGSLLVLAGTESPAHSLTIIFFHLLSRPQILAELRAELSSLRDPMSWTNLEKLPFLNAVIEEGNRLSFGVTARTARIAHEELVYIPSPHCSFNSKRSYILPAGTPISTTTLSTHTSPSVFPDPFTFDPHRWLGEVGRERRKYQMAFGKGGRKCLGIELAKAELLLVVSSLVKRFPGMQLWETGRVEVEFVRDFQIAMPGEGTKGVRVLVKK